MLLRICVIENVVTQNVLHVLVPEAATTPHVSHGSYVSGVLHIEGATCGACVTSITQAVTNRYGIAADAPGVFCNHIANCEINYRIDNYHSAINDRIGYNQCVM